MWLITRNISLKQVNAEQLQNPVNPGNPLFLNLYQREGATAFFVSKHKKVFAEYVEAPTGKYLRKRDWSGEMTRFAEEELAKIPAQKSRFRVTVFGWILLLFAVGLLGYLVIEGLQAPAKKAAYEEKLAERAQLNEGDIYFGNYRTYKEKGSVLGGGVSFGWLKVLKIEGDTYYIAPSTEMSDTSRPKEEMNSTAFESEGIAVKAKELDAYSKILQSEDGLHEFYLSEKKE